MSKSEIETRIETLTRDLGDALFLRNDEVKEALSAWFRGFYSGCHLIERLDYLKQLSVSEAAQEVRNSADVVAADGEKRSGGNTRTADNNSGSSRLSLVADVDAHEFYLGAV